MNVLEWLERKFGRALTEEELEEEFETIIENQEYVLDVVLGYDSEEQAADAYFKGEGLPREAYLAMYDDVYLLKVDGTPDEEQEVFTSRLEGVKAILALEGTLYPSIETMLAQFEDELEAMDPILAARVEIKVVREDNNSGHWWSFNIYYRDCLLGDGIFELDTETIQQKAQEFEAIHTSYKRQGIMVEYIRKVKASNFQRYYEFLFEKEIDDDFVRLTDCAEISPFLQGRPRWTTKYLESCQEDIEQQFESIKKTTEEYHR